jgi:hypothetical protein
MREHVYKERVAAGRMKREEAAHEYDCMLSVLATLKGMDWTSDAPKEPGFYWFSSPTSLPRVCGSANRTRTGR